MMLGNVVLFVCVSSGCWGEFVSSSSKGRSRRLATEEEEDDDEEENVGVQHPALEWNNLSNIQYVTHTQSVCTYSYARTHKLHTHTNRPRIIRQGTAKQH